MDALKSIFSWLGKFLEKTRVVLLNVATAFILIAIAYPSFKLIYLIDEVIEAGITIKVIGHQWY